MCGKVISVQVVHGRVGRTTSVMSCVRADFPSVQTKNVETLVALLPVPSPPARSHIDSLHVNPGLDCSHVAHIPNTTETR